MKVSVAEIVCERDKCVQLLQDLGGLCVILCNEDADVKKARTLLQQKLKLEQNNTLVSMLNETRSVVQKRVDSLDAVLQDTYVEM